MQSIVMLFFFLLCYAPKSDWIYLLYHICIIRGESLITCLVQYVHVLQDSSCANIVLKSLQGIFLSFQHNHKSSRITLCEATEDACFSKIDKKSSPAGVEFQKTNYVGILRMRE